MRTLEQIHEYWRNNKNINFYKQGINRSKYLASLFKRFVDKKASILEFGCNVGRNLAYLQMCGYNNLIGVEINKKAIDNKITTNYTYNYSIEDFVDYTKDMNFDIIFTMAVFEHIHPNSNWIFPEIEKMTKMIICIEDEKHESFNHFKRNYREVFKNSKQIYRNRCTFIPGLGSDFIARVFKTNQS